MPERRMTDAIGEVLNLLLFMIRLANLQSCVNKTFIA